MQFTHYLCGLQTPLRPGRGRCAARWPGETPYGLFVPSSSVRCPLQHHKPSRGSGLANGDEEGRKTRLNISTESQIPKNISQKRRHQRG
ncbi:hypothetical protein CesoFtcFv8_016545 [Champsocephalus esox]|uniref:Uncharacterized protein n=1 Tax=Champsocephalus esox TaxID=159716 RepID=A0AAN8BMX0_9TELE|nr:hypothetical protein CesoFtcFv8_016545 [Champsocephalus esox]